MNKVTNILRFCVLSVFMTVVLNLLMSACGHDQKKDYRTGDSPELIKLKKQILKLEGTVTMINNFVAGDYSTCDAGALPPFETKICRIAQTANAEQAVIIAGRLNRVASIMQESLYGVDCINDTDAGCPVAGSISEQIGSSSGDISTLQTDVGNLQTAVTTIEGRLDNFNGTGNSLEVVIAGIESDITTLEGRVDDLESVLGGADYYEWIFLCHDITASNEPVLLRGDGLEIKGYVNSASDNGMGQIALAGTSGDQYLRTDVNPRCRFKIYDLTTSLKICWNNTNRNASSGSIDTECDSANSFATPTANCTCEG